MSVTLLQLVADLELSLAAAVNVGGTTATLSSATDDDNVALPSGKYGFTIDGDNSAKEFIVCDLVGTALTNVVNISRQGASTAGFTKYHRVGAVVTITDWAILSRILNNLKGTTGFDSSQALSYDGAVAGLTGNQIPTVNYVLSVVNGGTVTFDQQVVSAQTMGENVTALDHVYLKEADNKWWKVDADLTATFAGVQRGIALATTSADATCAVSISGPTTGFSGRTPGAKQYASNTAGAISETPGTNTVFVGWALSATSILFAPYGRDIPSGAEKDAMAGGSTFGTPSSTNKYITQDYNSSATGLPVVNAFGKNLGDNTTQFDITNPAGTTFRYTYDGTGTNPGITALTAPIGATVYIYGATFATAANNGTFTVTGSGANYFEVTNASGGVESNRTIGTSTSNGFLRIFTTTWTKPAGLKYVDVECIGSGGSGGGSTAASTGACGGAGGGYSRKRIAAASLGATETVTVGAWVAGGSGAGGANGNTGNTSSFGSLLSATGGFGGNGSGASLITGATGGNGIGGDVNITGGQSGPGTATASAGISGKGGDTVLGLGGGSTYNAAVGTTIGLVGSGYGAGGSGGNSGSSAGDADGGRSTPGIVIVTEYYS